MHAIQPHPCSLPELAFSELGVVAAALEARRFSSSSGMS